MSFIFLREAGNWVLDTDAILHNGFTLDLFARNGGQNILSIMISNIFIKDLT